MARLASQELSPSITPCPSAPWPPVPGLGICGVAPGRVGVGPVGAVVPGPPDDFRLHVVKKGELISAKNA